MFRKFRIYYYNNKVKIWLTVGIVVFIYVIINIINYNIKNNEEGKLNNSIDTNKLEEDRAYLSSEHTIINNENIEKDTLTNDNELIKKFIEKCNEGNVEDAYNMLSTECKEEVFPSLQSFYDNYYKSIFTEKKSYNIETWGEENNTTYKVQFLNDIMAYGKMEDTYIQDYYTISKEQNKLNIKGFIAREKIEKQKKIDGLEILVDERNIYNDYEIYEVIFKNNSNNQIILDTKENSDTIYLKDRNGTKYKWIWNEIPNEYLLLNGQEDRKIKIKFNKIYNPNKNITSINFDDINIKGPAEKQKIEIVL